MIERLFESRGDKQVMAVYCAARAVMNGSETAQEAAIRYCVSTDDVAALLRELVEMEGYHVKIAMADYKKVEEICKN